MIFPTLRDEDAAMRNLLRVCGRDGKLKELSVAGWAVRRVPLNISISSRFTVQKDWSSTLL
jgi:hypothetical protein